MGAYLGVRNGSDAGWRRARVPLAPQAEKVPEIAPQVQVRQLVRFGERLTKDQLEAIKDVIRKGEESDGHVFLVDGYA